MHSVRAATHILKLTLERKIQASYGFGLVLLLLFAALAWGLTKRTLEAARLVDATQAVVEDNRDILLAVLNLETSARGFVISGDESFLEPLHEAVVDLPVLLARIARHRPLGDELDWNRQVEEVGHLVNLRRVHSEELIGLRRAGETETAMRTVAAGGGKRTTDEIRTRLDRMDRTARQRLQSHLERLQQQTELTRATVITGLTVAVLFLGFATVRVTRDLGERRRAELALAAINRELEMQTARLREANRELEAFSYSVSHDLRAPLRGVDGFSRMLAEDYGSRLDDEGRRLLGVIRSEAHRMGQLIDDLLNFSRAGRQQLQPAAVDMVQLAREVAAELTSHHRGTAPEVVVHDLPPAWGDRALLKQVWANLLANALKFSAGRQPPRLELGGGREPAACTYFVRDNGVGFDPRHGHKLFGVFQRLHAESEFEGTGVGLALVQRIIHRHGGTVRAEGRPGDGATFHFTLPQPKES